MDGAGDQLLARAGLAADWYLEGRVVGGRISLKAWKVGSPEPSKPLLSVRDRTFGPEDGTRAL